MQGESGGLDLYDDVLTTSTDLHPDSEALQVGFGGAWWVDLITSSSILFEFYSRLRAVVGRGRGDRQIFNIW